MEDAPTTSAGVPYVAMTYIDRMDLAYAAADFALCRAGAMTCAELTAVGLPAAYVPLPIGNGEQRLNALPIVQRGGGLLVEDAELTADWIKTSLLPVLTNIDQVAAMSEAAAAMGRKDADRWLAKAVIEIVAAEKARAAAEASGAAGAGSAAPVQPQGAQSQGAPPQGVQPGAAQPPESLFTHIAGLKVVIPSTPYDAKGLLIAAIEDPDPVIFFEPKRIYNGPFDGHHDKPVKPWSKHPASEVPEGHYTVPIGRAQIVRPGNDVTVLAYGTMVHVAEAAVKLAGVDAELIRERLPGAAQRTESIGLPVRPVERESQQPPAFLAQRRLGHQRLELADHDRGLAPIHASRREALTGH